MFVCVFAVMTFTLLPLSQTDADKDVKKISKVVGSELLQGGTGISGLAAAGGSGSVVNRPRRSSLEDLRVSGWVFSTLNETSVSQPPKKAARCTPFRSDSTTHLPGPTVRSG